MNNNNNPSQTVINTASIIKARIRVAPANLVIPDERKKFDEILNYDSMLIDLSTPGVIKVFELQESNIVNPTTKQKDVKIILRRMFPADKFIFIFEDR